MTDISEFLEHHDKLVVKEVATSHYQLINLGSDEIWGTYACPAIEKADAIQGELSEVAAQLPQGKHHLRLQAIGTDGTIRGQIGFSVDGRSGHAKAAMSDAQAMQKAVRMNVETSEQQLQAMAIRQQQAEERALRAERHMADGAMAVLEMQGLVTKMMNSNERHEIEMEERRARNESLKEFAQMFKPAVPYVIGFISAFADHKKAQWDAAKGSQAPRSHTKQQSPGTEPEEKTH